MLCAALGAGGCVAPAHLRGLGMLREDIPANSFTLYSLQRISDPGKPVHIYIEGDGRAWISRTRKSSDPTPRSDLMRVLASRDRSENVAYLARPCQFIQSGPCDPAYWGRRRFAPEVIETMNLAVDRIKAESRAAEVFLTGYSGGGTVALLLAAQRNDIAGVTTIAGMLDHRALMEWHGVSALEGSLNPVDFAGLLRWVPQRHFFGKMDRVVPRESASAYLTSLGETGCAVVADIPGTDHVKGWKERWPALEATKFPCERKG
jgi:pimeloyl-ACP methyl ester carboxylesterase